MDFKLGDIVRIDSEKIVADVKYSFIYPPFAPYSDKSCRFKVTGISGNIIFASPLGKPEIGFGFDSKYVRRDAFFKAAMEAIRSTEQ